jgi:hypothetical protein
MEIDMTASQAQVSYNDQVWIGRQTGTAEAPVTTWTQILGLEPVPFPENVPEEIDVTHQQSPGRSRETRPGLSPAVDATLEKQMWLGHAGDTLLITLADAYEGGTREDVLIEFLIDASQPLRRTYRGHIISYIPQATVGDKRMASVGMKIFERQATNPRTIAP